MAGGWFRHPLAQVVGLVALLTGLTAFAHFYYDLSGGLQRLEEPGDSGPPGRRPLPADPERLTALHAHLEALLEREVHRVEEAVVVIADRNAYVGLALAPHPAGDQVMARDLMAEASVHLRVEEPRLVGIFVTVEPEQLGVIRAVRQEVAAGRDVSHFEGRLGALRDLGGRMGSQYFTPGNP